MDWDLISDGLTLSLFGILTTFMALGLFIFSMFFLRWLFPTEKRRRPSLQVPVAVPTPDAEMLEGSASMEEEALAAAIAAAMVLRQAVSVKDDGTGAEAAAAAAAAWWLKSNRSAGQPVYTAPQASARRHGLGAHLESGRGRWWKPMGSDE